MQYFVYGFIFIQFYVQWECSVCMICIYVFMFSSKGPQPAEQYGTRAVFGLSDAIDETHWSAAVTSPPGETVSLSICSAPDAPIGRYALTLDGWAKFELILLFNPWCPRE